MSSFQISHACAALLSALLFPLSVAIVGFILNGGISEESSNFNGVPLLMFFVGPIFLVTGPLIGVFVHFKVNRISMKLVVYLVSGMILSGLFFIFINNGGNFGWYILNGLLAGLIYISIQLTTEKVVKKMNLPE